MVCTHRPSIAIVQWGARKLQLGKEKLEQLRRKHVCCLRPVIDPSLCVLEHGTCSDRCIRCVVYVRCAMLRQRLCLRALLWEA